MSPLAELVEAAVRSVRRNIEIVIILAALYVALFFVITSKTDAELSEFITKARLTTILGASLFLAFSYLLFRTFRQYLDRKDSNLSQDIRPDESRVDSSIRFLEFKFSDLADQLSKRISILAKQPPPQQIDVFKNDEERFKFRDEVATEIAKNVTLDLRKNIASKLAADAKFDSAEKYHVFIKERLYRVVEALERRANLNLAVGATIGAAGIFLLIYLLYLSPPIPNPSVDYGILALQYFSRISIVFLVEVFAFFFLKLYSQTLAELRYTHNEITNVEMKSAGLNVAIASADKKAVGEAARVAITTERNFILDKGKTTVDLEKFRHESKSAFQMLAILKEFFVPRAGTPISQKKTK